MTCRATIPATGAETVAADRAAADLEPWPSLLQRLRRRFARRAGPDDVDDVVQDAVLVLWRRALAGEIVADRFAFCVRVAQRRLVDGWRALHPAPGGDAADACPDEPRAGPVDWVARLRREGLAPSAVWAELLLAISSGVRTTRHLARVLDRDPSAVRWSRRRLQRWLAACAAELAGDPAGVGPVKRAPRRGSAVIVALAAGLAGCQATSLPTSVALSARFVGEVRIDGAAARMLFDTGCTGTLFERGAAARLGLPAVEVAAVPTPTDVAGHRRRAEGLVLVRDLALGDALCGSFHAPLLPPGGLPGLDGTLGMNVLGAFSWIFDVPAGGAVLVAPGKLDGELHRRGLHVEARLPLVLREQAAFVTVHLDGQAVEMHLDSGAATTTLTHPLAAALALPAVASDGTAAVGIHGAPRLRQSFAVARLRLGTCELREVTVSGHLDGDPPTGCMLGADVLGRIRWAVDWSQGEMLLLSTGAG